jgi:hypothetical protein
LPPNTSVAAPRLQTNFITTLTQGSQNLALGLVLTAASQLVAVYLIEMACQVATAALFYLLLRPVNGSVALTAAFLELTGCIIKSFARVFFITSMFVLGGAASLSAFRAPQLQSLALLLLKVNDHGAAMALAFFGFSTTLNGFLIFRSTFLPKFLGVFGMTPCAKLSSSVWASLPKLRETFAAMIFGLLIGL